MPKCGIGLMVKFPILGEVKSRLGKEIGDAAAKTVYKKLLDNITSVVTSLPSDKYYSTSFIEPSEYVNQYASQFSAFDNYIPQTGVDLGARMFKAVAQLLTEEQVNKAILIGADIPDINGDIIKRAAEILESKDLVVGPTFDGGYYLIGMKKPTKELFENIEWGTDVVFDRTISIAKDLNFKTDILIRLSDIDNLNDLKKFDRFYSIIN